MFNVRKINIPIHFLYYYHQPFYLCGIYRHLKNYWNNISVRSYASNTSSTTSSNTSSTTSSTTTTTNGHSKVLEAGQQVKYMTGIAECETGRFIDPAGSYRIRDGDHQLGDVHVARSAVVFKWNFDKISAIHNALNSLCSGGVYAENGNKLLLQVDGDFIRADNNLVPTYRHNPAVTWYTKHLVGWNSRTCLSRRGLQIVTFLVVGWRLGSHSRQCFKTKKRSTPSPKRSKVAPENAGAT